MGGIRTLVIKTRVECPHQYTTTPPRVAGRAYTRYNVVYISSVLPIIFLGSIPSHCTNTDRSKSYYFIFDLDFDFISII